MPQGRLQRSGARSSCTTENSMPLLG